MSDEWDIDENPADHQVSAKKAIAIGVVALLGVSLGSLIVIKKDDPGEAQPLHQIGNRDKSQGREPGSVKDSAEPPAPVAESEPLDMTWTQGMVYVPGGRFKMGTAQGHPDESPVHEVEITGFWMDETEVTNESFAEFVEATGYVTTAERKPDPVMFPGVPEENLVAGAVVFTPPESPVGLNNHYAWWRWVKGASWKSPEGPGSSWRGREHHPVVHVSWDDAVAYCAWAKKRLPTEAEWEYAARGGKQGQNYVWGDELKPEAGWQANVWQGTFPNENHIEDGHRLACAVRQFAPNEFGLYDLAGNVWEWCHDWYLPDYYGKSAKTNPQGPNESYDPNEPGMWKRVQRGGSFLCAENYCTGYRPSARMKNTPDTGSSHSGFRCVKDGPDPETLVR